MLVVSVLLRVVIYDYSLPAVGSLPYVDDGTCGGLPDRLAELVVVVIRFFLGLIIELIPNLFLFLWGL